LVERDPFYLIFWVMLTLLEQKHIQVFQLVPTTVTLNDLELHNSPYFALFHQIQ